MWELVAECDGSGRGRYWRAAHAFYGAAIRASIPWENVAVVTFFRHTVVPPLRSVVARLHDLIAATLEFATDGATITQKFPATRIAEIITGSADQLCRAPFSSDPRPRLRTDSSVHPSPIGKPFERPTSTIETISPAACAIGHTPCQGRFVPRDKRRLCFIHQKSDVIALFTAPPICKSIAATTRAAESITVRICRGSAQRRAWITGLAKIYFCITATRRYDARCRRGNWWRRRGGKASSGRRWRSR
ncbi:MAG: hypothetical protein Greene041662_143 [Candidatus Peregrinibacteria bacterium Greene0416_62]|nr:MAG: hypothetical protein Greene041662_143 [Candidatus Peregrinibacteria bacterium Greene0416_62]